MFRKISNSVKYLKDYFRIKRGLAYPSELIFFVSDRCNAKCGHCFWWKKEQGDELSLLEIEKIALAIKKPLTCLRLTGGEPFLRDDLAEVCDIFWRKNGTKAFNINTNGMLTSRIIPTVERMLKMGVPIAIQVSVDGLEKTHDRIRGVEGAFKQTSETIAKLREIALSNKNLKVSVLTVISNQNCAEIKEYLDYSLKNFRVQQHIEILRGTKFFSQRLLSGKYNPQNEDFSIPPIDNLEEIYDQLKKISEGNFGFNFISKATVKSFEYQMRTFKEQKSFCNCLAGNYIGVIYSNSDISICEMIKPIGNLRKENFNFKKIWHSKQAKTAKKVTSDCYCCHGCFFQPSSYFNIKCRLEGFNFTRNL